MGIVATIYEVAPKLHHLEKTPPSEPELLETAYAFLADLVFIVRRPLVQE